MIWSASDQPLALTLVRIPFLLKQAQRWRSQVSEISVRVELIDTSLKKET